MNDETNDTPYQLTGDQADALGRFIDHWGDDWRRRLYSAWMTGNYRNNAVFDENDAAYLQQIRNNAGPDWLRTYQPKEE